MTDRGRQRGMLLGLAIGDALGAAVEFQPPGTFAEVTGFRGGGPHGLEPGEWTDDTSMALALADSIADVGWDLNDQAERYCAWWCSGAYSVNGRVFDIGVTTSASLCRFVETGDARTSGDRSVRASGNGSITRLAPVPIAYRRLFPAQIDLLVERAVESSLPTHASPALPGWPGATSSSKRSRASWAEQQPPAPRRLRPESPCANLLPHTLHPKPFSPLPPGNVVTSPVFPQGKSYKSDFPCRFVASSATYVVY
jgi:hypothetical protein